MRDPGFTSKPYSSTSGRPSRSLSFFRGASISWFQVVSQSVSHWCFSAIASTGLSELFFITFLLWNRISIADSAWIWRWLYLYLDGDSKARGDRLPTSQVVVFLHLARILYWSWSPKKSSSSTWAEFNDWLLSSSSSRNLAFFCLFSLTLNKTGSVLIITTCNSRLSP